MECASQRHLVRFGEDKTGESSSNTSFQDIPCYNSTDLAHWTRQSSALTRQGSGDLGPNRIVERPKVIFNSSADQYVMYIDNSSYGEAKVGVATSSSACGLYSYRGSFQPLGLQSRDIALFQDTDGTGYLLSEDRANGLRIDRPAGDYLSVTSGVALFADFEAPAMVKIGGTCYVFGFAPDRLVQPVDGRKRFTRHVTDGAAELAARLGYRPR